MLLIKNGKFFLLPERSEDDFKALFARVAAAGVGRPVDQDGCPQGPWTPDLLAAAISEIETNRAGIELRTVQLWFEDNDKGISATNIGWLARVLGCNDPEAASAWQAELSAAQSRLMAKRRARRRKELSEMAEPELASPELAESGRPEPIRAARRFDLAHATEVLFSRGSVLNLPAAVFAGAVALQFVSYFLSIHSVTYLREDGVTKQVGFLWTLNWTVLFVVFLPLFLAVVVDQVVRWKSISRAKLLSALGDNDQSGTWMARVEASSHTYWAVFLTCIGFAGVFQWISVRLLPLLNGVGDYAVDWGSVALVQPDQIGVVEQIAFTGIAYLYMCFCFYLLIAGLILLSNLVDDFVNIRAALVDCQGNDDLREADASGYEIISGIVRCTIAGLLVAICMKLESFYRLTPYPDIWNWMLSDAQSVLLTPVEPVQWDRSPSPTHYTSLLVAFLVSAIYLYGSIRIGTSGKPRIRANLAIVLLIAVYLVAGVIPGFSLILAGGLIVALHGLFDPDFQFRRQLQRDQSYVP
ncbi:MAG: hypothetical protein Q7J44_22015 [Pseudotabrizicola sp.]|uniref:RcgA family putative transporter n=1 Tax=Pseudotabrizicola sp. TaxID=2939647 RepID=UPI00271F0CE3|nr:hypothetical protein [Pseudotabrizicola sp.]MDO9641213.1 hypothetical protein [Pseudotabrizicola sp.]